ncbi:MAG: Mg2+ and Co2+ transporter CorB [Ruminococcaceae bacterium]|nr:Mg2+ and Co2+ transporter CorB [Oscillospiraceae bacterium]
MKEEDKKKKIKIRSNNVGNRKVSYKWVVTIIIWSFCISSVMQMIQAGLMSHVTLLVACLMLFSFVLIGVIFDIIGVAVTAASEVPFHSLAARRVRGAKEAIRLIRNADKVGSFCNDVIGDIVGIVSGSATTAIVVMLNAFSSGDYEFILSICLAGLVAAMTIGGKAVGKGIAMMYCNTIIFTVGKLVSFVAPIKRESKKK